MEVSKGNLRKNKGLFFPFMLLLALVLVGCNTQSTNSVEKETEEAMFGERRCDYRSESYKVTPYSYDDANDCFSDGTFSNRYG